jgi:hypothetical protein
MEEKRVYKHVNSKNNGIKILKYAKFFFYCDMRRFLSLRMLRLMLTLADAEIGNASTSISSCTVISSSGEYVLTTNITNTTANSSRFRGKIPHFNINTSKPRFKKSEMHGDLPAKVVW